MNIKVSEIAREIGAELIGDGSVSVVNISPIQDSAKDHITFIANKKYVKYLSETKASAVIIGEDLDGLAEKLLKTAHSVAVSVVITLVDSTLMPFKWNHKTQEFSKGFFTGGVIVK